MKHIVAPAQLLAATFLFYAGEIKASWHYTVASALMLVAAMLWLRALHLWDSK